MKDTKIIDKIVKTIFVKDREFKIAFISNYVYMQVKRIAEALNKAFAVKEKLTKVIAGDTEAVKTIEKELEAIKDQDCIKDRYELVKEILESNELDFDEKWWLKRTSPLDVNNFIYDCIHKDFDTKKKETPKDQK